MVQVLPKHQGWFPDTSLMIKEYDAGTLLLLTKLGARNLMLYTIANIPLGGHDTPCYGTQPAGQRPFKIIFQTVGARPIALQWPW